VENKPVDWAGRIKEILPDFSTEGYIIAGFDSTWNNQGSQDGSCPGVVAGKLKSPPFAGSECGGAFIWNMGLYLHSSWFLL
jgi:hypothetical protein